jgi:hypothetical protein
MSNNPAFWAACSFSVEFNVCWTSYRSAPSSVLVIIRVVFVKKLKVSPMSCRACRFMSWTVFDFTVAITDSEAPHTIFFLFCASFSTLSISCDTCKLLVILAKTGSGGGPKVIFFRI